MKLALAQINPILGDFKYNCDVILNNINAAKTLGADLVLFPECSLFGYYPADLLERVSVVKEQFKYLKQITKKMPKGISALVGFIDLNTNQQGKFFRNSAALISYNKVHKVFHKTLLPTYDIFDEGRHFEPSSMEKNFFTFKGKKILVTICEDIWAWKVNGRILYSKNPILDLKQKCDLVINLSASPYTKTKIGYRKIVVSNTAKTLKAPMIYLNQYGAQDETIFDGNSFVVNKKGEVIWQLKSLDSDLKLLDFETINKSKKISLKGSKELEALTLGIKDFFQKTGFKKAHLGLSGGIDSAVVYVLACHALGAQNVTAIALPTEFNSPDSLNLAKKLCNNLGQDIINFPIEDIFQNFKKQIDSAFKVDQFGLIHENLQARIRANILMAYSNQFSSMLLATSNKTEMAVGYTTIYGDMCGGLAPIGDLTKTEVYDLAKLINAKSEVIPEQIITRPPSAELRTNQKDQDSLPEYKVLDASVINIVQKTAAPKNEVERWTLNALMKSEFKRWQAPPILKVTDHAFGQGRRFPIAHKAFY